MIDVTVGSGAAVLMYMASWVSSVGSRCWKNVAASELSGMSSKPFSRMSGITSAWVFSRRVLPVLTVHLMLATWSPLAQMPSPFLAQPFSSSSAAAPSGSYRSWFRLVSHQGPTVGTHTMQTFCVASGEIGL